MDEEDTRITEPPAPPETAEQMVDALLEEEAAEDETRLRRLEDTMAGIERSFAYLNDLLGVMINDQARTNRNLRTGMDIVRNHATQVTGKKSGTSTALQRLCDELDRQRQGEPEGEGA